MFAHLSTEVGREASVGVGENKKWTLVKMLLFLLVLARPSAAIVSAADPNFTNKTIDYYVGSKPLPSKTCLAHMAGFFR